MAGGGAHEITYTDGSASNLSRPTRRPTTLKSAENRSGAPSCPHIARARGHVNVLQIGHVDTPRPLGLGLPRIEVTIFETLVEAGDKRSEVHGVLTSQRRPIGTDW
jgi:hypothetical protein